ncbi:MAG: hypothetical protein KC561_07160 [Myxococcales bacterium]|nr:hypothetical protein [Myxococcales bacterium]
MKKPIIVTRLAHAGWLEHRVRGLNLFETFGADSDIWDVISTAIGGPRLTREGIQTLNNISLTMTNPDPRIPPMKLMRVCAAYGGAMAAYGGFFSVMEDALIGTWSFGTAASALLELEKEIKDIDDLEAVTEAVLAAVERRGRIPGYGVPAREKDERVIALRRWLAERGRAKDHYFRLMNSVDDIMSERFKQSVNIAGAGCAACLDVGLAPRHIHVIGSLFGVAALLANADEGAQEKDQIIQSLPDDLIEYQGPPRRRSPRSSE